MKHAQFGNAPQPSTPDEKSSVAREVMGLSDGKAATKAPKFHSMHIASAENGYIVEHTQHNNPTGPNKETKTLVTSEHPAHKHIQALSQHCSG